MRSHARVLFAVTALFMLFAASPAQASKTVQSFFGNAGSTPSGNAIDGGLFNTPRGIAVNVAGTGGASAGDIYVVNGSANRVDQFSASGAFIRAFGRDVLEEGKANNNGAGYEICDTTAGNAAADCKAGVTSPAEGGTLSSAQGIAVNQSTGHLYVSNQSLIRVDEFDATGHFVRAFGQDVVSSGPGNVTPASAKQTLTVDATEGQFKLSFRGQSTADIAFNAPATGAGSVQTALQALSTVGAANATVTGGPGGAGGATPYVITFAGALANAPMPLIGTAAGTTPLGGGAGASVANTTTGATAYEICTAPADTCKTGTTGSVAGAFKSTFSGQLAVAPAGAPNAGNVIVADPANLRVNEYSSAGVFVRSFGFDVTKSPPNATTTFETCDASNFDVCQIGTTGSGVGQFATNAVTRIAVDTTGAIYAVEPTVNFRVQKFTPQVGPPTLAPSIFAAATLTGTSSSGSTQNNPTDIAIGASNHVFVVKVFPAGTGTPAANAQERRVLELDSTGSLLDTHLAQGGVNGVNGLGANASNGRLYLSSSSTPHRVYVLADAVTPTATIAASTGVSATEATLHGSVIPGGVLAGYHFEYVDDAQFQVDAWASAGRTFPEDAGNASSPGAVSADVEGLAPNTLYHVRVVVTQTFGTLEGTSPETTFTTSASSPFVAPSGSAEPGTTTVTLIGRVKPNGQPTSYFFRWGPTSSYGSSTPVEAAGSGIDSVFATTGLAGLTPDQTYHFRLVATNSSGTTEGPDHTFTTREAEPAICPNQRFRQGSAASLPDCRAYEQVSPVDKNSLDVSDEGNDQAVSTTGDSVLYAAPGSFAGLPTGGGALGASNFYFARRQAGSWTTAPAMERPTHTSRARGLQLASSDLSTSVIWNYEHAFVPDPQPPNGVSTNYLRDNLTGATSLLYFSSGSSTDAPVGSSDLSRIAFQTGDVLVGDPGVPVSGNKVYAKNADGSIELISREPGTNQPFSTSAELARKIAGNHNVMSSDGSKTFFVTPLESSATQIYRRDGEVTELASPSRRGTPDPLGAREKKFWRATPDGSEAFFTSSELLTDNANTGASRAGSDLYSYDFDTDRLHDLSAITGGDGARVVAVLGVSDDGNRAYYAARGIVAAGGTAGQLNLYLWEDDGSGSGDNRFIATLDPEDEFNWSSVRLARRVSADGRFALLLSKASLTGYANEGTLQVYRYDAEADGGDGDLDCVSCDPDGDPPGGSADVANGVGMPHAMSEDGRYVFFDTSSALAPPADAESALSRDTNGVRDAYVWEGGDVELLSTGTSPSPSTSFGATADGGHAFFTTREKLVPQDLDANLDLYVAAIGGGLDSQQAFVPPSCAGEGCRGSSTSPPPPASPLTSAFAGQGNVTRKSPPARCAKGKRRVRSKNGRTRCVKRHKSRKGKGKRHASKTGRASR